MEGLFLLVPVCVVVGFVFVFGIFAIAGDARPMDLGGRVIEATAVNGVAVKKPKHPH